MDKFASAYAAAPKCSDGVTPVASLDWHLMGLAQWRDFSGRHPGFQADAEVALGWAAHEVERGHAARACVAARYAEDLAPYAGRASAVRDAFDAVYAGIRRARMAS